MKLKHNKKRNTAFLYETLMRELTKSILSKDANNKSKLAKDNLIIVAGYGVGLSWGSALIKWGKIL